MSSKRTGEIRLHTDPAGHIWLQAYGGDPVDCGTDTAAVVLRSDILAAASVRIYAMAANAKLIEEFYKTFNMNSRPCRVQLGNARNMRAGENRLPVVFSWMGGWDLAPSLGGWRSLTAADYVTYALTGVLQRSEGKLNNLAERLLRAHPAWPALAFIDADLESACQLICEIGDPRWHVDPTKPDAGKKLLANFGFGHSGLRNISFFLKSSEKAGLKDEQARLVLNTWTAGNFTCPPAELSPRNFLWRLAQKDADKACGLVRGCRVFLAFLRDVWLDSLTPARRFEPVCVHLGKRSEPVNYNRMVNSKVYSPQLFVPEHFFELASEVRAWREHAKLLRQRV